MADFYLHFDVPAHSVSLETFVSSAKALQRSLNATKKVVFDDTIEFELFVDAPAPGSLLETVRVVVKPITNLVKFAAAVAVFDQTPMGEELAVTLTGKMIREWVVEGAEAGLMVARMLGQYETEVVVGDFLVETTKELLSADREKLENLPVSEEMRYEYSLAQSELFTALIEDKDVNGLGFSATDEFPLRRSDFARRAVRPENVERKPEVTTWEVSIEKGKVTSPDMLEMAHGGRMWRLSRKKKKPLYFSMEDDHFWAKIRKREVVFADESSAKLQVATRIEDGRKKESKVIRVLSWERQKMAAPLDKNGLALLFDTWVSEPKSDPKQGSLF